MALQKQAVNINFQRGLDTKSDPYQVPIGKFLTLVNSVFDTTGRLTKRNGFEKITTLPNTDQTTLTTLSDSLVATGSSLYAYNSETDDWLNQGTIQPIGLDTTPLVRNSSSQTAPDIAIAQNGLSCLVYVDNSLSYYHIIDSVTGQQVVARTALPSTATNPRVFILKAYFIITFMATVSGSPHFRFIAIPIMSPTNPGAAADISSAVSGLTAGHDGFSINDTLYVSWYGSGTTVKIAFIDPSLTVSATNTISSARGDLISVTGDADEDTVWVSYWNSTNNNGFCVGLDFYLNFKMTSTQFISSIVINELTSISSGGILSLFFQVTNTYAYDTGIRSDFIDKTKVTPPLILGPGTASANTVFLRSVGLASKPFIGTDSKYYVLVTYGSTTQSDSLDNSNQPSDFLVNIAASDTASSSATANVVMRLAYSNAGGYASSQVLPSVTSIDDVFHIPYLITDFLTSVNKMTASNLPANAIYTQKGVSLAKITIDNVQYSSELAGALHLTGGQLWEYDGVRPVEHGFHVWPENISASTLTTAGNITAGTYYYVFTYEWTDNAGNLHRSAPSIPYAFTVTSGATFTANTTNGGAGLSNVSSFTGLQVGQPLSGTGIQAGAKILTLNPGASSITMTMTATATNTGVSITATAAQTIEINVPTLRLTYKTTPNPVRIVGYRWTAAQPIYYQFTSIPSPTLNSTTTDYVAMPNTSSDAQILGGPILYTTGGVVEDIAAPASSASTMFNNRLFLIDAEDQNLLWFSKQVIQNVPVEMSDLLTIYVAPTTGAQGSTGPMTALSAMDDKLIIFKKDAIYYVTGNGPDNTGANSSFSDAIFITATVGCTNPNSIVLIPNGLMFQSDKGIWILGRDLNTQYIGADVEGFNNNVVLSAKAIPGTNQVRFILDNSKTLMYDYFYNQWVTHTNVLAISSTLYQGRHTYMNSAGQILKEASNYWKDSSTPVLMSLTTSWISVAGLQGYERFYFANLLGTYMSPFKLSCTLAYDYNASATQNIIVTPDNYGPAYGEEAVWGAGGPWGGGPGNVFTARLFPEKQKCETFQLSIQEVYDNQFGSNNAAGLSLSGLALTVGVKRGTRTQSARRSFG